MDTVHDLGGRQGFGPIPNVTENDTALFVEEWKARTWAIAMMAMGKLSADRTGWTLDWYRHVLERLPPDAYISLDYFEKWILAMIATSVDEGIADAQDFYDGRAGRKGFEYDHPKPTREVAATSARFNRGDKVIARRDIGTMHTRLTGYVRGRPGVIDSVIGQQPLPDEKAVGKIRKEETYVVRFNMADLWPETSGSGDSLLIDMWDSYLEPA
jgi:nitrile hydratase